jgi:hypothetical protein
MTPSIDQSLHPEILEFLGFLANPLELNPDNIPVGGDEHSVHVAGINEFDFFNNKLVVVRPLDDTTFTFYFSF